MFDTPAYNTKSRLYFHGPVHQMFDMTQVIDPGLKLEFAPFDLRHEARDVKPFSLNSARFSLLFFRSCTLADRATALGGPHLPPILGLPWLHLGAC